MSRIESHLHAEAHRWQEAVDAAFDKVDWEARPRRRRKGLYLAGSTLVAAAALVAVFLAITLGGNPPATHPLPVTGDCAAPILTLGDRGGPRASSSRVPVSPGQTVRVTGRYFVQGCQDSVSPGRADRTPPVSLVLVAAGGHRTTVATARPKGAQGTFTIAVVIPSDTPSGEAILTDRDDRARLRIHLRVS